jgi:hypothetical protein
MRRRVLALGCWVAALGALEACTSAEDYVVVTVEARSAVRDATALTVTLANAGTTRTDTLELPSPTFPVTFSVSTPGRTGELAISVDARAAGLIVGHGTTSAMVGDATARVVIDSADFVVNTELADHQFTSNDFEASGFQLAALPDGTWTAVFRDSCQAAACNLFARRFDARGAPVPTAAAAGTNAFHLTTQPTSNASTPAVAANATTTVAVWDSFDDELATSGVACRALDAAGNPTATQRALADDDADVVDVAALSSGNFVASWSTSTGGVQGIHAVRFAADCTPLDAVFAVSDANPAFIHRAAVAGSGASALFTWIVEGDLHARVMSNAGTFVTADSVLVARTATEEIVHARIAPVAGGFLVAARWVQDTFDAGPGRIEVLRVDSDGARIGDPILITDRSASDVDHREAFGFASRADTAMVAWHACGALGDDSGCGVFGRLLRDTGAPLGEVFRLATTTAGDQTRPSVVGLPDGFVALWTDDSQQPPDTAGQSVRARVLYPAP